MAYLDENGLLYVWNKIKTYVTGVLPTKVSDLTNDAGYTTNTGTITKVKTTAGSHTAVDISSGAVNMNVPTKTSHLTNDSGFITSSAIPSVPSASSTSPKMDGSATAGTENAWAKGDHVHPTDTSLVPKTTVINGHALSGNVVITPGDISYTPVSGGYIEGEGAEDVNLALDAVDAIFSDFDSSISNKVDKVTGKGLSTNDYTTGEKNKLAGIAAGAEVNVQSDWNVSDTSSDAFIKNKPTIPSYSDATTSASGLMSASDKTKLNGIATGAEVNQNAFSYVQVGSLTLEADAKQDTLTLEAGSNVQLAPSVSADKVIISATDTTYQSKAAASGGTAVSLVTTGEKYTWNNKANTASPAFSGTPTAPTASAGTNNTQIATTAFVSTAVANAQTGSAKYKGSLTAYSGITVPYSVGDYWVVKTAGQYAGQTCEVGDMIFCHTAKASGGTKADADFDIVQSNITAIPNSQIDTICV